MILGALTWIIAALACYVLLRRLAYNLLDPVLVLAIFVPFSAALLAVLCSAGLVPWDKFVLFSLVLLGYLIGARSAGALFGRRSFRRMVLDTLAGVRESEVTAILAITLAITLALAVLAIQVGAEGDARQAFLKAFRPIALVQTGLFEMSLILLASPKLPARKVALPVLALVGLSIPFSGKAVFIPVIYWFGLRWFLSGRRLTLKTVISMASVAVAGVIVMGLLVYRQSSFSGAIRLLAFRLWMSGDAYIFAYQQHGLALVRSSYHASFLAYMLHPITALFGVRAYDVPLGGMLEAAVTGTDRIAGPNPQLPVVLDFFFPNQLGVSALIAFMVGFMVMIVRPACLELAPFRGRYLKIAAIAAAIFYPGAGFQDTSQVLIGIIGLCAAGALGASFELLFATRRPRIASTGPPEQGEDARLASSP